MRPPLSLYEDDSEHDRALQAGGKPSTGTLDRFAKAQLYP